MTAAKPWTRRRRVIAAAVGLVALAGAGAALMRTPVRFVEYRMIDPQDAPIAIAAANGTVWFTIDHADAIGRVQGDRIERLPTGGRNIEPVGLAAAAEIAPISAPKITRPWIMSAATMPTPTVCAT